MPAAAACSGLLAAGLARPDCLLAVRVVPAALTFIWKNAQFAVLRVFDLQLGRRFEPPEQSRSGLQGVAARLLEEVPHGVAALIVNDPPGRARGRGRGPIGRLVGCAWLGGRLEVLRVHKRADPVLTQG